MGWAIWDSEKGYIDSGSFKISKELDFIDRMICVKAWFKENINNLWYDTGVVAFERMFLMGNRGDGPLAAVSAMLRMMTRESGRLELEISVSTIRKDACGNGKTKKAAVQKMMEEKLGKKLTADEADAVAVAISAFKHVEK